MNSVHVVGGVQVFLREVSCVSPLALMLLGGSLQVQHEAGLALVDGWIQVRVPAVLAVLIKKLRSALQMVLADGMPNSAAGSTGGGGLVGRRSQAVTAVLQRLLQAEKTRAMQG